MLKFDVKRKINTLRDILVGKVPDPKAQVEQITIAMIYKFMDDMDIEAMEFGGNRKFFTGEYEKYAWTEIMQSENGGQQRANLYAEGIDKMAMNPNLPQLFRDIFRGAYVPYRDPDTLNMFLKEISDFTYDNSEDLGNAFEYLLSIMGSQGDAGQFRTPRHIIDMIVNIVDPKKNESILDPACGTAGFLISAYKHIADANKDENGKSTLSTDDRKQLTDNFAGYDISPDMVRLARVNMYLHQFTKPQISEYDTLSRTEKWDDSYDVILANPPFMTPKGGIIPHNRYRVQAKRAELLFVDYIAEHLNPTGRAGIIVPEGIVFQSANAYKELRKYLIEDGLLYAVISLPAGVFNPYSGVKTSVLLFDKPRAKCSDNILFVKMQNDGFDLGAQRREIKQNDIPKIVKAISEYKLKMLDDTDIELSSEEKQFCTIVNKTKIAEQDYILVGERYKESVVVNSDYPMIELSKLCDLQNGYAIKSADYVEFSNTLNFRMSNIRPDGSVDLDYNIKYLPDNYAAELSDYLLQDGDVVIAMTDMASEPKILGVPTIIKKDERNLILNQRVGKFKDINQDKVFIPYLKHILNFQGVKEYYKSLSGGGLQINIGKNDILNIKIPLPPLHIQEEIVTEIEIYQKIIDGAKQIVDNYKPTVKIDPSWEMVKLGDVCELNPKKTEVKDLSCDVSFVPMAIVSEKEMNFVPNEIKSISEVYSGYTYFKDNDVLLAKVTPCFENGKSGMAKGLVNSIGFGSSEFFVLRASEEQVLPELLYYTINANTFINEGKKHMTGTGGLQRLSKDYVLNYPIYLPPLETQQQIVQQINEEMAIVEQNKRLIAIFEQKIADKIAEVWGE